MWEMRIFALSVLVGMMWLVVFKSPGPAGGAAIGWGGGKIAERLMLVWDSPDRIQALERDKQELQRENADIKRENAEIKKGLIDERGAREKLQGELKEARSALEAKKALTERSTPLPSRQMLSAIQPPTLLPSEVDPEPRTQSQIKWKFKNNRDDAVSVTLMNADRTRYWPSKTGRFVVTSTSEIVTRCSIGERICYGAWDTVGPQDWGLGRRNHSCVGCCRRCGAETNVVFQADEPEEILQMVPRSRPMRTLP